MDDLLSKETALNDALRQGRLLEAYTTFYHEGARHLTAPAGAGDASVVTLRFFEWADLFVGAVPVRTLAGQEVSCSEWRGPGRTLTDGVRHGTRVVARQWRDGKVVHERVTERPVPPQVRPLGVPQLAERPLRIPAHG
jgi:hypothetical protein